MMTPDADARDAGLTRMVETMRQSPPVPLPASFADEVTQRLLQQQPPEHGWAEQLRAWVRWLYEPRVFCLRPAIQVAWVVTLCVLAGGVTRWYMTTTSKDGPAPVLVRFAVRVPAAREVSVAGDFNAWSARQTQLEDPDGDGVWHGLVPVQPGVHQYMFVIDGQTWMTDPLSSETVDDGFGQRNSLIRVQDRRDDEAGRRQS